MRDFQHRQTLGGLLALNHILKFMEFFVIL